MKTTMNLDDDLVRRVMELTGIQGKTALIHEGLRALLEKKARERPPQLGGTLPGLQVPPRRRS